MTPADLARDLLAHPGVADAWGTMVIPASDVASICRAYLEAVEALRECADTRCSLCRHAMKALLAHE